MATLSGQKNFGAFLTPLSLISHPICQQIMLALLSKYPEFGHVSPPWSQTTVFHLDYCKDFPTGLVCSCPGEPHHAVSLSQMMSLLAQNLPMNSCPKSALLISFPLISHLISRYSSPYWVYSGDTDLALPQTLQGLVYFRAFVLAVPSALSSHGLPRTCSHTFFRYQEPPSWWDLPWPSHLQFQICIGGLIFLP